MAERQQPLTPMDILGGYAPVLTERRDELGNAQAERTTAEQKFRTAQRAEMAAQNRFDDIAAQAREDIHRSAEAPGTDPIGYVQAFFNTISPQGERGDQLAELLTPLRQQLVHSSDTPVVIVTGGNQKHIHMGLTVGGPKGDIVAQRREHVHHDPPSEIGLSIPLNRASRFSDGVSYLEWRYFNGRTDPHLFHISQSLSSLRVASDLETVQTTLDVLRGAELAPHFDHLPFIFYGKTAVQDYLKGLYEDNGGYYSTLSREDILAATVTLDIQPERITDKVNTDTIKTRLHHGFVRGVEDNVQSLIQNEIFCRESPGSERSEVHWSIGTSPKVMSYAEIPPDNMIEAVRTGIELSAAGLKPDNTTNHARDDQYRLTQHEAAVLACRFIGEGYDIDIDPRTLRNDDLARQLDYPNRALELR